MNLHEFEIFAIENRVLIGKFNGQMTEKRGPIGPQRLSEKSSLILIERKFGDSREIAR